jgi:hypothetical protein
MTHLALPCLVAAALFLGMPTAHSKTPGAHAAPHDHSTTKATRAIKPTKAKNTAGSAPRFIKGSEEGGSERERRLLRECKGRVNAGACAGFTG